MSESRPHTVYLSRWVTLDVPSNLRRLDEESAEAVATGADLVVFPEAFLHGYRRRIDPGEVRRHFEAISRAHHEVAFVFGSFTEQRRNRLTVWRGGTELARYDKVHLFEPNGEQDIWDPGDRYAAVDLGDWTLGLVTCNDIRFPEQARALRLDGRCDALVAVAWWPWRRDHVWSTLLRARAIENGIHAIGCCVALSEHPDERFAGAGNHVFDPFGDRVQTADDHVYRLDLALSDRLLVDPLRTYRTVQGVHLFGRS